MLYSHGGPKQTTYPLAGSLPAETTNMPATDGLVKNKTSKYGEFSTADTRTTLLFSYVIYQDQSGSLTRRVPHAIF